MAAVCLHRHCSVQQYLPPDRCCHLRVCTLETSSDCFRGRTYHNVARGTRIGLLPRHTLLSSYSMANCRDNLCGIYSRFHSCFTDKTEKATSITLPTQPKRFLLLILILSLSKRKYFPRQDYYRHRKWYIRL